MVWENGNMMSVMNEFKSYGAEAFYVVYLYLGAIFFSWSVGGTTYYTYLCVALSRQATPVQVQKE